MQNAILFQMPGALPVAGYLPGLAQWDNAAVRLTSLRVRAAAPFTGAVTLSLEVNGALTGDVVVLAGAAVEAIAALAVTVPAGQLVRWQCAYDGAAEAAPLGVQAVLGWAPDVTAAAPVMQLVWRDGTEILPLFRYDPGTGGFTDISNGLAAGRAGIDTSDGFSFSLNGAEILRCRSGVASAVEWHEGGLPPLTSPWLCFEVDGVPWLVLGAGGAYAGFIAETSAWPVAEIYFDLLAARVTAAGCYAASLGEPLP